MVFSRAIDGSSLKILSLGRRVFQYANSLNLLNNSASKMKIQNTIHTIYPHTGDFLQMMQKSLDVIIFTLSWMIVSIKNIY